MKLRNAEIALLLAIAFLVVTIWLMGESPSANKPASDPRLRPAAYEPAFPVPASAEVSAPANRAVAAETIPSAPVPEDRFDPCANIPAVLEAYLEKLATSPEELAAAHNRSAKHLLELTVEEARAYHIGDPRVQFAYAPAEVQDEIRYMQEWDGLYRTFWLPCARKKGEIDVLRHILLTWFGKGETRIRDIVVSLLTNSHLCEDGVVRAFTEQLTTGNSDPTQLLGSLMLASRKCNFTVKEPWFFDCVFLDPRVSAKDRPVLIGNVAGARLITLENFSRYVETLFAGATTPEFDRILFYSLRFLAVAEKDPAIKERALAAIPQRLCDSVPATPMEKMARTELHSTLAELGERGIVQLKAMAQQHPQERDAIIHILLERRRITLDEAEEMRREK